MSTHDDSRTPQGEATAIELLDEQAEARIRRVWHDGRWFFSVIDVVELLSGTGRPRKYWTDLKTKLAAEGSEVSAKIGQLKYAKAAAVPVRYEALCA